MKPLRIVNELIRCWRMGIPGESTLVVVGWLQWGDTFVTIKHEGIWFYGLTKYGVVFCLDDIEFLHK